MSAARDAARDELRPPFELLKAAHEKCLEVPGSSTACIIVVSPEGQLNAVNLGDSGFIVVRRGQLLFKTKEQQHYFNCPFQIGSSRDMPDDAHRLELDGLEEGDVLVACTDGVFDNLFTEDVVRMVTESAGVAPGELAQKLAEAASRVASDGEAQTPFQEAARNAGQVWQGGKLDDITVLVATVGPSAPSRASSVPVAQEADGTVQKKRALNE